MGTSTSSRGGRAGSPFDPEWLDGDPSGGGSDGGTDPATETRPETDSAAEETSDGESTSTDSIDGSELAPARRFGEARSKISGYLAGGGREDLRGAARSMINRGMGGPRRAASTMQRTAQGAGQLGQFLTAARDRTDVGVTDWVERVRSAGLSANDLILEVVKQVLPDTGSVDEESLRNAAAEALGKLYEDNPDIDIFDLSDQQISNAIGYVIANDVCNRMDLQLGQTYERLKHDPQEVQRYRNDVKEWVHEEVRAVMDEYSSMHQNPHQLAAKVLTSALKVFAE